MEEGTVSASWLVVLVGTFICCFLTFDASVQSIAVFHDFNQNEMVSLLQMGLESSEPIDSGPPVEDMDPDVMQKHWKRGVPVGEMTNETKLLMVQLHNMYRNNVTPPAADMSFIEWDTELEHTAQLWADNCIFEHGHPDIAYSKGAYGQNLYMGTDPSGNHAVWMWYEEYLDYNFHNKTCPEDKKCGHYLTMAASKVKMIGCARKKCSFRYFIVCHYSPPLARGEVFYEVGRPCSQCLESGDVCFEKLCITRDQCKRNPEICAKTECNLKCQNCGRFNEDECRCECADGWDSSDCSRPCMNKHEECFKRIANKYYCLKSPIVKDSYCREMCDQCHFFNETATFSHTCCDGKLCPYGYVLDFERDRCKCIIYCPGPLCDVMDENEVWDPKLKTSGMYSLQATGVSNTNNIIISIISFLFLHLCISIYDK